MTQIILLAAFFLSQIVWCSSAWAAKVFVESDIKGFELKTCNREKTRCLKAQSPLAQGSSFRPIFMMSQLDLTIEDHEKKKTTSWSHVKGYYDPEFNQLVLIIQHEGINKEIVVDLKEVRSFEVASK